MEKKTIKDSRRERRGVLYLDDSCIYCNKGKMIYRTSKYGEFIGCSNFPYCAAKGIERPDENKGVRSGGATIEKRDSILDMVLQQVKK